MEARVKGQLDQSPISTVRPQAKDSAPLGWSLPKPPDGAYSQHHSEDRDEGGDVEQGTLARMLCVCARCGLVPSADSGESAALRTWDCSACLGFPEVAA